MGQPDQGGRATTSDLVTRGCMLLKRHALAIAGTLGGLLCGLSPAATVADDVTTDRARTEFFENRIRPILVEHCQECHGPEKQESGFALVSRDALLAGGQSGPAVVPGMPDESLLVQAVRYDGREMPPDAKLGDDEIAAIEQWVRDGAAWTTMGSGDGVVLGDQKTLFEQAKTHWALQPVRKPAVPDAATGAVATPIDAFLLEKLTAAGIEQAPRAPPRTLIRRLSFDLRGLPPTPEEVDAFMADLERAPFSDVAEPSPAQKRARAEHRERVWRDLVEKFLASPHYGERWGRHWLDVARYADTRDFLPAGADRTYPFAWTYRDWVVKAFNEDMPFDRFLKLQIAADAWTETPDAPDLAALGMLTVGPRFINTTDEQMADRIDVIGRGFLGLTISCARCHDHKYDPIPTADYYGLYGVFASCEEPQELPRIAGAAPSADLVAAYEKVRAEKVAARTDYGDGLREKALADLRKRPADYLLGYHDLAITKTQSVSSLIDARKLDAAAMTPLSDNLDKLKRIVEARRDPVLGPLLLALTGGPDEFKRLIPPLIESGVIPIRKPTVVNVNPLVLARLRAEPPADVRAMLVLYGRLFADVEQRWREARQSSAAAAALDDPAWEAVRLVLHPPAAAAVRSPFAITGTQCIRAANLLGKARTKLAALDSAIREVDATHPGAPPRSFVLVDKPKPVEPVVFLRGDPQRKGPKVSRHFLTVLGGGAAFTQGSGRKELAEAIASPSNPLTARVFVNRVWAHHFGKGLVDTPSDFGFRANRPSHPELLDWLAATFVEEGWSVKALHRRIVLSNTYRLRSEEPRGGTAAPAETADPGNRLLAHASRRRLDFESMRDAMLATTGGLDATVGGRPVDLSAEPFTGRRTLYGHIDRLNLDPMFSTFDFASPDVTAAERPTTMVPQQALFAMNHPFVIERARAVCGQEAFKASDDAAKAGLLYRALFQRPPTPREALLATEFVRSTPRGGEDDRGVWRYGRGDTAAADGSPGRFSRLAHFDGQRYQEGPVFPDPVHGYSMLLKTGGHPGPRGDAVIRRWVSPVDGVVAITGQLQHLSDKGDGVHGRIVRGDGTVLGEWTALNDRVDATVAEVPVKTGDVLDFAVDCRETTMADSFSWAPVVTAVTTARAPAESWNAQADFAGPPPPLLTPWEQCAQALLLTNEFWFVD
jgi:mono/diheme cytochrome c family protein